MAQAAKPDAINFALTGRTGGQGATPILGQRLIHIEQRPENKIGHSLYQLPRYIFCTRTSAPVFPSFCATLFANTDIDLTNQIRDAEDRENRRQYREGLA